MAKESIIKHYSSSTTGNAPSSGDLVEGELAINTADEKVFFKNLGGAVVDISQSKGISGTYARLASSVSSVNGLTGAVTLTGDGGAVVGVGNNTIAARLASTSLTGVASFNSSFFSVSSGAVSLASPYSVIGVTGIGFGTDAGLTGKVNLTAGSNITITQSGNTITFAASGGGGGVTTSAANTWTATQTFSGGINVSAGATFTSDVKSNIGYEIGSGAINARTNSYTLQASDDGKIVTMNSASATTITIDTTVGTTGFTCSVIHLGTGTLSFVSSGTTLNTYSGLTMAGRYAAATILCYATNTFSISGNLL